MSPVYRMTRRDLWIRRGLLAAPLLLSALFLPLVRGRQVEKAGESPNPKKVENKSDAVPPTPAEKTAPKAETAAKSAAAVVEVRCIDGSTLKLTVRDERIEFITPYGKLLIPVRDIERIEVAFRIPEEVARRVEAAIADLGKADFQRREAACDTLLEARACLSRSVKSREIPRCRGGAPRPRIAGKDLARCRRSVCNFALGMSFIRRNQRTPAASPRRRSRYLLLSSASSSSNCRMYLKCVRRPRPRRRR